MYFHLIFFCGAQRGRRRLGTLVPFPRWEKNRKIIAAALIALRGQIPRLQRYKLEEFFADVDEWTELTDW